MEKNNKLLTIILVLLIILFVSLGVYIAYDRGLIFKKDNNNQSPDIKDNSTNEDNQVKTENLDINTTLVQRLYNFINKDDTCSSRITEDKEKNLDVKDIDIETKLVLTLKNIDNYSFEQVNCNNYDFSNFLDTEYPTSAFAQDSFSCGTAENNSYNPTTKKFGSSGDTLITESVKASVIEKKFHEIFGTDTYKNISNIYLGPDKIYVYNKENDMYVKIQLNGDCGFSNWWEETLETATKESNTIVLKVKKTFSGIEDPEYATYEYYYTFTLNQDGSYYLTNIKSVKA